MITHLKNLWQECNLGVISAIIGIGLLFLDAYFYAGFSLRYLNIEPSYIIAALLLQMILSFGILLYVLIRSKELQSVVKKNFKK
ncbi:MAG: hypothetical protein WDZ94_04525 [Patescibacteria group bacterium]